MTFKDYAAITGSLSPSPAKLQERLQPIYKTKGDVRSEFDRDYTRILHSYGFRRLKHKTQVFFNAAGNDHICTRMEHVTHVESVAFTIAENLGLNLELIKAIAIGHDIGHAPFGHHGETVISTITGREFWHEQNGLRFIDDIELLPDLEGNLLNLNLTYAVRDGIISHCGELDEESIRPRTELIDLKNFTEKGEFQAATWEGCVVKLSDKIAYLGRDIEDASILNYFDDEQKAELKQISKEIGNGKAVNTTSIIHRLITDLCENSTPDTGLKFSPNMYSLLCWIKDFNYRNIYKNPRLTPYQKYANLIITEIYNKLISLYKGADTISHISSIHFDNKAFIKEFADWLPRYCNQDILEESLKQTLRHCKNKKIYGTLSTPEIYQQAVIDYIAGMTDVFAVKAFEELLKC
ncbi:MAG: HD domain-containing protein [Paludibacteraceae bacterium]|nr:HD domain-containing protein [Paludibacteraceae bacterium]